MPSPEMPPCEGQRAVNFVEEFLRQTRENPRQPDQEELAVQAAERLTQEHRERSTSGHPEMDRTFEVQIFSSTAKTILDTLEQDAEELNKLDSATYQYRTEYPFVIDLTHRVKLALYPPEDTKGMENYSMFVELKFTPQEIGFLNHSLRRRIKSIPEVLFKRREEVETAILDLNAQLIHEGGPKLPNFSVFQREFSRS